MRCFAFFGQCDLLFWRSEGGLSDGEEDDEDGCCCGDCDSAKPLTGSQRSLLGNLQSAGTEVVVGKKFVSMNDLRNLTLHTGDEFAMLTRRGERMIIRGDGGAIPTLNVDRAAELSAQGWRFSGHTHTPGFQAVGSLGDKNVLRAFGQRRSAVWGAEWGSRPGPFFGTMADEVNFRMGL